MALTDTAIRQAKPAPDKVCKLFDGRGLYVLIPPSGGKWWRLKYRFGGKEKLLSLGTYPDVRLKQAREKRDEARSLLASGIDPGEQRKTARAANIEAEKREHDTFEEIAGKWFEKYKATWVPAHAYTVKNRLGRDVLPWLGRRPVSQITAVEVLEVLHRVENRGALEVAHRIKQIIGQVFRYAVANGKASRDPTPDLRGALPPRRGQNHAAVTTPAAVGA